MSWIIIAYFSFPHSSALLADILHFRLLLQSGSEKQSKDESPPVLSSQISKGKVGQEESLPYYKSRLDFDGTHTGGRQKVKRLRDNFFVVDPGKIFRDGRRHSGGTGPASWRRFAPRHFIKFYQSDLLKILVVSFFWLHPARRDCHWVTYLIYFFLFWTWSTLEYAAP